MPSVIIIGSGPAGVSASLYTVRAGLDTTVISTRSGALAKADKIENYYGFPSPVSGAELCERGIAGAERLGVKFVEDEAVSLSYFKNFIVKTPLSEYTADAVILATGASRLAPNIEGIKDFEGRGVSYCAVCDGFFFRGRSVGVLGSGEYALHEASELLRLAGSVTVFTDGEAPTADFPENTTVVTDKLARINGGDTVQSVESADGRKYPVDGLFIAYKTAGSTALAKKIGAAAENNKIIINESCMTSVKGLFAAGDCTGGLLQISKAVYEGAKAGTEAVKWLKSK